MSVSEDLRDIADRIDDDVQAIRGAIERINAVIVSLNKHANQPGSPLVFEVCRDQLALALRLMHGVKGDEEGGQSSRGGTIPMPTVEVVMYNYGFDVVVNGSPVCGFPTRSSADSCRMQLREALGIKEEGEE